MLPSGHIKIAGGSRDTTWVSLDGLVFLVSGYEPTPLDLHGYWQTFDDRFEAPSVYKHGSYCVVSGAIKVPDFNPEHWSKLLTTLPEECMPYSDLDFIVPSQSFEQHVSVFDNGDIEWKSGETKRGWLSLSGISFFTSTRDSSLMLEDGFSAVEEMRYPAVKKQGVLCVASGTVSVSHPDETTVIGTVPGECTPRRPMVFTVSNGNSTLRVDVSFCCVMYAAVVFVCCVVVCLFVCFVCFGFFVVFFFASPILFAC